MSPCCSGCASSSRALEGTNRFFTKSSKRYLKQFRKKGLAKEQKYLIEGITRSDIRGASILDIGCGVGALHFTLLQQGATEATGVDISEGMLNAARELAGELGFAGKTTYLLGDFAQLNGEIHSSDITMLDKVVCCYENVGLLLDTSLDATKQLYALSYPHPNWFTALFFKGMMGLGKILAWAFHPYWHDWGKLIAHIRARGFTEVYSKSTFMWDVKVFRRES